MRNLVLILAILVSCCTNSDSRGADSGTPILVAWQNPAYSSSDSASGLVIAVWRDGNVVRARGPDWVGLSAVRGRISQSELDSILSRVSGNNQPDSCKFAPLHQASITLTIRHASDVRHFTCRIDTTEPLQKLIWSIEISNAQPVTNREAKSLYPGVYDSPRNGDKGN